MKNWIYGAVAGLSLAVGPIASAAEPVASDPAADADCLISLILLMEAADEADEDAIFSIAVYYFGRLGGAGYTNKEFITSRMGRFYDDENLYLTKSQNCAEDFKNESNLFEELSKALG